MGASRKITLPLLFMLLTAVLCILLIWRLAVLTLASSQNPETRYTMPPIAERVQRGTIYDRNGMVLAVEIPYYACAVMLQSVPSREKLAEELSPVLYMTKTEILATMEGKESYALIKQRLSLEETETLRSLTAKDLLPGVVIEQRYGRLYPQAHHASTLIGFTGIDNNGLEGIEYLFDDLLLPLPRPNENLTVGYDIYLTLDMRIQYFTDVHVQELAEKHNPDSVTALVLYADTGEVAAWSSYPWYDLNAFSSSSAAERVNRPGVSTFEPGSAFKIFSLAAILAIGEADTDETFLCDGSYSFPAGGNEAVIRCVTPHGAVGPREILKYSCNGAIAHYALQTDPDLFYHTLLDFGFSRPTGITIPGEAYGLLASPDLWSARTLPTIAFGQELTATAIQMAAAATVFSHGGNLLQPSVIDRITAPDGSVLFQGETRTVRNVLPAETAAEVLEMMVSATEPGGTAVKAAAAAVRTAAKTGTAQILDPETGTYSSDHVLASTIALVPADDPEYIIYVAADYPKGGSLYGSAVAAPAVAAITSDLIAAGLITTSETRYLELPPQSGQ
jgi:cell division protein FtsI (penicillin-binding protein 3)